MNYDELFDTMTDFEVAKLLDDADAIGDMLTVTVCDAELLRRGYIRLRDNPTPEVSHFLALATGLLFGAVGASVLWGIAWFVLRGR